MTATRTIAAALLALGLAACAVGPEFHTPAPPSVDRYTPAATALPALGADRRFVQGGAVDARWWTLFGSPVLNAMEDEALKSNADLKAAEAALRQARETYLSQRSALFPAVSLAAGATRAKNSLTIAPPLADNSEDYTLYQGQLNLSYAVDVFGGARRGVEAAAAQAESQRFQTEAAYLTLTANVANAALQLAGLDDQLEATNRIVAADLKTLDLVRRQQELGQASGADVAAAEAALDQAALLAPPLQKQIDLQRDLLADLLGRPGALAPADALSLGGFTLPRELPVSLPSELVRQRPDIRAAEANLHAASAQLGVAIAARLPQITLTGSVGGASGGLSSLLTNDNSLWSISGDLAQTVFDAGALAHRQKAAQAALDQAEAQYRSAVLAGLQNTADVLQSTYEDTVAYNHAKAADAAARRALTIAQTQLAQGEVSALAVLASQAAYQQAEVALAQAQASRYADTVALYQALGGGWRPEDDIGSVH